MSEKTTVTYNGIGFPSLLTILFIGLKLTGHIDWDWIWVVSPLWIPLAIIIFFILGWVFLGFIAVIFAILLGRK